ncbi:ribosomal protein S18 acetylase RimI-like enzyme [Salirhabdus euzebyi]|uniref:Ribosomal protein S18 acetylase RimI-like enzyme n=1 Tax=Salirhabdus euzebyi TaxID=394506 RepID=A0A841PY70_9BACI|nr:GNAT family N-acetyltransferase [Salirhabdus euzebyi]MBB6452546.1 ribosomal protein S18 acetylase RimI-like enzyme [Salirhabdus euzebyi]
MYKIKNLKQCSLSQITNAWNEGFSDYTINFQLPEEKLLLMLYQNELQPSSSFVVFDDEKPVGFIFNSIKRIDGVIKAWNGGTGIAPSHRGRGISKILMEAAVQIYKENSVKLATLEVLTNNTSAIKLYEKYGYTRHKLLKAYKATLPLSTEQYVYNSSLTSKLNINVENLSFYNKEVAWESMNSNIHNKESMVVYRNENPVGYALYKRVQSKEHTQIILLQFDVCQKERNIEEIVNFGLSQITKGAHSIRTGDFISSNEYIYGELEKLGLNIVAERFLMELHL